MASASTAPLALPAADLRHALGSLNGSLERTLDALEDALAQLQGPAHTVWSAPAPRSRADAQAAAEAAAEVDRTPAPPVVLDTAAIHELLRRTHAHFGGAADGMATPRGSAPSGMTTFGFVRLLRASRLLGDATTQVDADLIFCRVVRSRNGRMTLGQMISALSQVALRHAPKERTQPAAFHKLLVSQLCCRLCRLRARNSLRVRNSTGASS
jgi:hypothetical protein